MAGLQSGIDPASEEAESAAESEPHSLESLGRGSILSLAGQLALVASTFGSRVFLVRYIQPLYGDIAVGLSLLSIITNIAGLGLGNAVARQLAHTRDLKVRWTLVYRSLSIGVPAAVLSAAVLILFAPDLGVWFHNSALPQVMDFLAVYMAITLISSLICAFFQGNEDALPNTLFNQIINPALLVIGLVVLLPRSHSLLAAMEAYVLSASITLVGLVVYTLSKRGYPWRRAVAILPPKADEGAAATWKGLLVFALPLAVIGVAAAADTTAGTLVLGVLDPINLAGAFYSVLPLANLVGLAITAVAFIMLPVSSRLHREGDLKELASSYATLTKWVVLASLPFFLVFFFLPSASLTFVYGSGFLSAPGYADTPLLLQITVLGGILTTLAGPASSVLIGLGRLHQLLIYTAASAVADLVISLALIPSLGPVGAAVAYTCATVLLPVLCVADIYLQAKIHPFVPALLKPTVTVLVPASALLLLLTGPFHWHPGALELVGLFFFFVIAYVGAVLATGALEWEDAHLLGVVEEFLGFPLTFVRRLGRRFLPPWETSPAAPSAMPPRE